MAGSLSRPLEHRFALSQEVCTLTVDLISMSSLEGVDVDIGREAVRIKLPGDASSQLIHWPTEVVGRFDVDMASAKFSRKHSQLILKLALRNSHGSEPDESPVQEAEAEAVASLLEGASMEAAKLSAGIPDAQAKAQQPADRAVHQAVSTQKVQGSGWNASSWHWEERPMIKWSQCWLEETLSAESLPLQGGLADIQFIDTSDVLKGDISLCVRKGRPVVLYELSAMFRWQAVPREEGSFRCVGKTWVREFTSEEGAVEGVESAEIEIDVGIDTSKGRSVSKAAKQDIALYTRRLLKRFLEELVNQAAT